MQRDTIVYFGIIQYEYNNAMCQHVAGVEKMISAIGYKAVTIGVSPNVVRGQYKKINETTYVVNDPQNSFDRIKECICSSELKNIIEEIGAYRVKTLIMADFRFIPMRDMMRFCKHNGIYYAVDIMDRFVAEESLVSKIKKIDCDIRMKYLYPHVDRRIHICSYFNELLGTGSHTAVIPGVTWNVGTIQNKPSDQRINLAFLGRPGNKCEKEKIDWVIKGIKECGQKHRFKLFLAGFDEVVFKENNKHLIPYFSDDIVFCGRLNKEECKQLLEKSDFSLVVRPDTELSKYGFSTKIGEAFAYGVPVLATNTSDNKKYITSGINGFICECKYEEVLSLLIRVSKMTCDEIMHMKQHCINNNPLYYTCFLQDFEKVVVEE